MKKRQINPSPKKIFEAIRQKHTDGREYWSARDLAKVLGYSEYRHFLPVIEKAKIACNNSGQETKNHFEDILEMVPIGSGAERPLDTCYLSRYACYLVIQNADPTKEIIAAGQTYFAIQTRKQELAELEQSYTDENQKRVFLREETHRYEEIKKIRNIIIW